jgi:hypothetical protein
MGSKPTGLVIVKRIPKKRPNTSIIKEERAVIYKVSKIAGANLNHISGAKEALIISQKEESNKLI